MLILSTMFDKMFDNLFLLKRFYRCYVDRIYNTIIVCLY